MQEFTPFIAGDWVPGEATMTVENKYTGRPQFVVQIPSRAQLEHATRALAGAQERDQLTPSARYEVLTRAAHLLAERRAQFIDAIVLDTGFTVADATTEATRAQQTLILSGEEAKRITGEMVPVDAAPGGSRRLGFTVRKPVGVVCAITPFNSPLNTLLHKVAPALAAGNAVIVKPSGFTPATADLVIHLLVDAGLPPGLIALVHGDGATVGQWLLEDQVPSFYAFTGSTEVGRHIRATIGVRRAQLELGSLSSTIICADANLDRAAALCVNAAFRKAGQVCTSVQRLYVHQSVVADLTARMSAILSERKVGDPADPDTFVGPVISEQNAERISTWISEAARGGAQIVHGGDRTGRVVTPTVLADLKPDMKVMSNEIFGPVVAVRPFHELSDAIVEANDTPFGLSAGIFTSDIATALEAADRLRVGTVHINETSSARSDLMPFGGVKASGSGHEGPKYATREMTEERLITIGGA